MDKLAPEPSKPAEPVAKPSTPLTPANVAKTPEEKAFRATAEGQKAMASRASRIALLMTMNEKIRQMDPSEAFSPMTVQGLPDAQIDTFLEDMRQTYNRLIASKPAAEPAKAPEPEKPAPESEKAAEAPEPPKIEFELPAPDSPEAKALDDRADKANAEIEAISDRYTKAKAELEKAGYGTKRRAALEAKVERLSEEVSAVGRKHKETLQDRRLMYLEHLAQTGDPSQRWAAAAELMRKRAEIYDRIIESLGQQGDTRSDFYWRTVERAREAGKQARAISDQGYKLFTERVSKQLQDLGATKEEADFEAGQIVNMQFSYPGTKSVAEAPLRMKTIEQQRLREETSKRAEALKAEFGVLHDTGFERRAREVYDKEAADRLIEEHRQEYQRRKDEQTRKEEAEAKRVEEQQAAATEQAKEVQKTGKLQWRQVRGVWTPVEGKPVDIDAAPNHSFFMHRVKGSGWTITEKQTGLDVGQGKTQAEAIKSANERIGKLPAGDFQKLVESKTPPNPPPIGPGAAARAEFEEESMPSQAAIGIDPGNPLFNRLQRLAKNLAAGVSQIFKRRLEKQDLSQLANAADNIPRVAGKMAGEGMRLRADKQDRIGVTFLMQALKMSGDGIAIEDAQRLGDLPHAGDPVGYLRTGQTDMETAAQVFLNQGKKLEAQAAIDAAKALKHAADNYARLLPTAREARRRFNAQWAREQLSGVQTDYERWYVPQRHELDLFTSADRPIVLGDSKAGGLSGQFKKAKVYEDYISAIEDGFIPRNLDIADLLEHRVVQGERIIQRKALFNGMRSVPDPVDGKPLAMNIPRRVIRRPDGSVDVQESVPRGYQAFEVMPGMRLAIHDGYARLMRALTATSQISESAVIGTLADIAAVEKHIGLALDTFHASRVMQAELMLTGRISVGARQKRGLALVEYSPRDLNLAVQKGAITQEMADWVRTPLPVEVGGRTVNLSPHALFNLGLKNGVNVARIADVMYRDWLREVPITGSVNKWVFDKLTRSAMAQSFISEFQRVARNNPHLSATRVARMVASDINVFFGNLQKESIFKNPSVRAINQILFLAPNWVEALARREFRAIGQFAQAGREFVSNASRGEINLPNLGTVGKGIGSGLIAYFAATQLLNLFTRGHLTFQNPEPEHKLDAWIPSWDGKGKGFFISPLSVFGEITHDILRFAQTKPDLASGLTQIAENKLGNIGRFLQVLTTGRDPLTSEKLIGTGRRAIKAAVQLVPIPISLSQAARAGAAAIAPGVVSPPPPGAVQRQITASAGFKTEPAQSAQMQVYRMADAWKTSSNNYQLRHAVERRLKEDFGPSDYKDLRSALSRNDLEGARRAYDQLLEGRSSQVIRQAIEHPHPFTGSKKSERAFLNQLQPQQRVIYKEAMKERMELQHRFEQMLREKHK